MFAGDAGTSLQDYQNTTFRPARASVIGDTVHMPASSRRHFRPIFLLGLTLAGLLVNASSVAVTTMPATSPRLGLTAKIDALIAQPRFVHASWGIAVVSLESGRTLYAHRADQLGQPASTAKLFTAAVSLDILGPGYRFPTRLLSRGVIRNGRLDGQLILYGMGDPTLGTADSSDWAAKLASQLHARGIRQVHGDLIADDSYFTGPSFGTGWEAGDLQSWFAVPTSALSVDENIVDITLTPSTLPGQPASARLAPLDGIAKLLGQIQTTRPHTSSDINLYRAPGDDTLYLFGSMPAGSAPEHYRLAMVDPALQAARQLRTALARQGIRISGSTRVLHWPMDDSDLLADTHTLGELFSPPLGEILQRGLKRSQNLYLQNLLLGVGAHERANASTPPTTFADSEHWGIHALRDLLTRIGIPPDVSRLDEGTGLSRRNLVTPDALVHLLVYLSSQPSANQVREALPLAGVDGTLTHRMRDTAAAGNVQAKTGSMSYVHSLAGYVTTAAGKRLAFVLMLDNYEPPAGEPSASSDLDAIAVLLAEDRGND